MQSKLIYLVLYCFITTEAVLVPLAMAVDTVTLQSPIKDNIPEPPLGGIIPISLPDLGDASASDLSNADEKKLGEKIMQEIRKDPDYLSDYILYDYLNQIGKKLATSASVQNISGSQATGPFAPRFEFFGVRDKSVNAFALPGGYIGIHTGLLVLTEDESEFASVLGHEIGHITQKHIARGAGQGATNTMIVLASVLLAALAAKGGNGNAMSGLAIGGQALAIQNQLAYSRDAEREADRVGFQILDASGFNVNGMPGFFQRLQRATVIMDSGVPSYVKTHPLTIDRISDMQDRVRGVQVKQSTSSIDFYLMKVRAKIEQESRITEPVEVAQFFMEQTNSVNPIIAMQGSYGLALLALNQKRLDESINLLKKSRELSLKLKSQGQTINRVSYTFDLTEAEINLQQKRYDLAIATARHVLTLNPTSNAAGVFLVKAQLAAGKTNDAIAWLERKTKVEFDVALWWDFLAQAYAVQNKQTQYHAAMAEKYVLEGALPAAIQQLKIAKQEGDGDFYQLSAVEARARQLESLYLEDLKDRGIIRK